jgi:ACS family glucarate transporter-like MFS transporter
MAISEQLDPSAPRVKKSHHRFVVLAVLFSLSMLTIVDRVAVSAAKMDMSRELGFTDITFGLIFGAFALGYALFQIPAGLLADRFGSRLPMASVVGLWSLFTGLTIFIRNAGMFVGVWFLFGTAEAGAYPISARVIRSWLPARETGMAQGILFSGSRLGAAFGLTLVSWSIARFGWRSSFVVLGLLGILWAVAWLLWFRNTPEDSPWTSAEERAYIRSDRELPAAGDASATGKALPRSIWKLRETPALMLQYFASNFTFFLCFTWLLPYLRTRYQLGAAEAGFLAAVPLYFGVAANWVSGAVVDRLYRMGWGRVSRVIPASFGFLIGTAAMCGAAQARTPWGSVLAIAIATFGVDLTLSPSWTLCIDIAGARTGTLSGAMNMCGNLGSFASSLAFPMLFRWTGRSDTFFYCAAAINLCAAFLWLTLNDRKQKMKTLSYG